jgi:hypothetical protein
MADSRAVPHVAMWQIACEVAGYVLVLALASAYTGFVALVQTGLYRELVDSA